MKFQIGYSPNILWARSSILFDLSTDFPSNLTIIYSTFNLFFIPKFRFYRNVLRFLRTRQLIMLQAGASATERGDPGSSPPGFEEAVLEELEEVMVQVWSASSPPANCGHRKFSPLLTKMAAPVSCRWRGRRGYASATPSTGWPRARGRRAPPPPPQTAPPSPRPPGTTRKPPSTLVDRFLKSSSS